MSKPCTLGKLFRAYEKAEHELCKRRDEEFPEGTLVMFAGMQARVMPGSLYADNILTQYGHKSWRDAKKINEPGVEK